MSIDDRSVENVIIYDENGNGLRFPLSGSTFPAATGLLPNGGKTTSGITVPMMMASGSLALMVTQTSPRPIYGEYSAGITLINGSASAQNLFSIENPTGSDKFVIVRKMGVGGTVAAVAAALFVYRMGRSNTFPSGGSIITATKKQTSSPNPVAIVRSAPAGSVTNNMWVSSPGTLITAAGRGIAMTYMAIDAFDDEGDVVLAPGEALIMIADNNDTDWRHYGFIRWQEST